MNVYSLDELFDIFFKQETLNYEVTYGHFLIKNKVLYSNKIVQTAICRIYQDDILLLFVPSSKKLVVKILKHFKKLELERNVFLCKYLFPDKLSNTTYAIRYDEMCNVFSTLVFPKTLEDNCEVFYFLNDNDIRFEKYLSDYIKRYDCSDIFDEVHQEFVIEKILRIRDYPSNYLYNYNVTSSQVIKDEEVINRFRNINRVFKINNLLKN